MGEPAWAAVLEKVLTVVIPIGSYLLGKATKGATNQMALDVVCEEVKQIKATQVQQTATLASHTTLHEGYVASFGRVNDQLQEQNRLLGELVGMLKR